MQQIDQKAGQIAVSCNKPTVSRNKREGRYLGWRVTGGRWDLNWRCGSIGHERVGTKRLCSLKRWAQHQNGGRP